MGRGSNEQRKRTNGEAGSGSGSGSGSADPKKAFTDLGVCSALAEGCLALGWKSPTDIQRQAVPQLIDGKDVIGLAQTGSGKTGAFALPILQELLDKPQPFFALVLSPTRELAIQIAE